MATDPLSFSAKLQEIAHVPPAAPPRGAQPMRAAREDLDVYGLPERPAPRRRPPPPERYPWSYDEWPFPFASFWTSLLAMALVYPAAHLTLTLAALGVGLWAGVRLDRWLRRHPGVGTRPVRFLLGVA